MDSGPRRCASSAAGCQPTACRSRGRVFCRRAEWPQAVSGGLNRRRPSIQPSRIAGASCDGSLSDSLEASSTGLEAAVEEWRSIATGDALKVGATGEPVKCSLRFCQPENCQTLRFLGLFGSGSADV